MTLDDVEIVNLETGAAAAAFAAGQLDAVGAFAPFTTNALKRSGSKVLLQLEGLPRLDSRPPRRSAPRSSRSALRTCRSWSTPGS